MSLDVGIRVLANTRQAILAINDFKGKVAKTMDAVSKDFGVRLLSSGIMARELVSLNKVKSEIYALGDVARQLNLPIEEVGKFTGAVRSLGGGAEEAFGVMAQLQRALADLRTEGKGDFFDIAPRVRMNISALGKDFRSAFNELRRVYRMLGSNGKLKLRERFGLNSPAMIKMLEASNEEYAKLIEKAEKFGLASSKTYKSLDKLRESMGSLSVAWSGASSKIFEDFSPEIDKVSSFLDKISESDVTTRKGIIWSFLFAGSAPVILKALSMLLSLPASLAVLAGVGAYGVNKMGFGEFSERFLGELKKIPQYMLGAFVGDRFGGIDPFRELIVSIKDLTKTFKPVSDSQQYSIRTNPTMIQREVMQAGSSGLAGMMLSGNTFNVNIVGSANPYEMADSLMEGVQYGVRNETNGLRIGGF